MRALRVIAVSCVITLSTTPYYGGLADASQWRQILEGTIELDRPRTISARRLIFNDLTIITNGHAFEINADTLTISGECSILAFTPRQPGAAEPGRSAGTITINVRDIDGDTLKIRNDGEAGGKGIDGLPGAGGQPGHPGGDAGGSWIFCAPGFAGGSGGSGGEGGKGGDGAPGGKGGDVLVNVDKDRDKLEISAKGGGGGAGGSGGPGGEGGSGGAAGRGRERCAGGAEGSKGPAGRQGEPGVNGADGIDGNVVVGRYAQDRGVKR